MDDLLAIDLLLFRILPSSGSAFTGTESADVNAYADVAATSEVGVLRIVARGGSVVFAVGQVFEQRGELVGWFGAVGHVQGDGETDAVLHGDPRGLHADAILWGRGRLGAEEGKGRKQDQDEGMHCYAHVVSGK